MKLNWRSKLFYLLPLVITLSLFHNCSNQKTNFSTDESLPKIIASLNTQENGSGGSYLGKPLEGDYIRTFPNYQCDSQTSNQGLLKVTTLVNISRDNCQPKDIDFQFTDSVLDFAPHNPDYLGVGAGIYEFKKEGSTELPVAEAWCQFDSPSNSFDIVAKVSADLSSAEAKVYLGNNGSFRVTSSLPVARSLRGQVLTFSSSSLNLQILRASDSSQFSNGHVQMMIDNVVHEQDVVCRIANRAPIEEMGTGLTNLFPINSFITDSQEAICSHPGVLACDNIEDRVSQADLRRAKFANTGWAYQPGAYAISSNSFDGSRSIEMPTAANSPGSGNIGFSYSPTQDLYVRFYIKWSGNFVFSPTATGLQSISSADNRALSTMFIFDSSGFLTARNGSGTYLSTFKPLVNQWYCVETRIKSATSAGNDGAIELWVNDVKELNVSNQQAVGSLYDWGYYGNWYCADSNTDGFCDTETHPAQSVFLDNVVMARQRIGCF